MDSESAGWGRNTRARGLGGWCRPGWLKVVHRVRSRLTERVVFERLLREHRQRLEAFDVFDDERACVHSRDDELRLVMVVGKERRYHLWPQL